jgi:hypothetical protein
MNTTQWARLETDANHRLRRGAWYRIIDLTVGEAKLDVNHQEMPVPRTSVKIVSARPRCWSVVSRPRDARSLPVLWGDKYAVCPECRNRAQLKSAPHSMRCPRCERTFRVGWEEWFVGRT